MKIKLFLIFALLLFSGDEGVEAAPSLPQTDGQTADIGKYLVEVINADSESRRNELVPELFSQSVISEKGTDNLVRFIKKLHDSYAPMEYHHSEINRSDKPEGAVYVIHVYARKKGALMWTDFQAYVESPPVQKIKQFAFIAEVAEPVNLPNGSIEQEGTIAWLNKYIEKLKRENDLAGSILIVKGDQLLVENYFGFADVERNIPVTKNTLFNMASGGKMFTALSIAKLVEAGKLKYDDKVTQYLGGFPDKPRGDKLRVHHLLSHTSGVAEYWSGQNDKAVYGAKNIDDHLRLVYQSGFDFESGAEYRYCNSNYILLGAIIEKVTGMKFHDYVEESVIRPAGMTATGYFDHKSANAATPLARGDSGDAWIEAVHGIRGSSAGGSYSNVQDILKFSYALKNNLLVSGETFENMISVKNKGLQSTEDYGYGFILMKTAQERTYGHGGTAGGVNFEFRYFPGQDVTLVLFSNQNNGAYDDLKKNSIKLISGDR